MCRMNGSVVGLLTLILIISILPGGMLMRWIHLPMRRKALWFTKSAMRLA